MGNNNVDKDRVKIATQPGADSAIKTVDDVYILVTQAYCPNGHNMVMDDNDQFSGQPGIRLSIKHEGKVGQVTLSPFHGDQSKLSAEEWDPGAKLSVCCPVCQEPLAKIANCRCEHEGDLVKAFLSPNLNDSHILALCNIWGCRRSHTIDNWQIISEYLEGTIDDAV